ncbi:voltage-dependent calcium channel gamma-7 subunit-like [Mytilus trossulus]|uniref:voltage-dependent calcium channel gamma-7 subunit-like n=1 Tax=Mytilus trossulus TaxID=6551 RepID=UPI0030074C60
MHCNVRFLSFLSMCLGAVAVGTMALAVGTDSWLFTEEETIKSIENGTLKFTAHIRTGLWRLCIIMDYDYPDICVNVGYENADEGREEGQETSMAIMRANRVSTVFPVITLVLLVTGFTVSAIGNIQGDIKTLIGSVVYISGGLTFAVGIILYISSINDEVGHRQYNESGDLVFQYSYGWSFYFAGLAFLFTMLSAVVQISLFLKRNSKKDDMIKIIPGLDGVLLDPEDEIPGGASNPTIIL